ncbi:MAG TPA: ABC transporter permease [Vicinamibacterales bacterium]|nr:ABC transporter permease [Vicinamibacterales bacterium]
MSLITALRSLRTTPGPVLAAILTLALAAGVNLAMFGLIDRALLSAPAGVGDADRLFTLGFQPPGDPASAGRMTTTSYGMFTDIRDGVPSLLAAAFQRMATTVMLDGEQRRVNAMLVSGEYFDVLRTAAARGRTIMSRDNEPGAPPVAVVSHTFWRSALHSDANAVGRRLRSRALEYEIAGVMPAGFTGHSTLDVDLWIPFAAALSSQPDWYRDRSRNAVTILARIAGGSNVAEAETQTTPVYGRRVSLRSVTGADVAATDRRVAWWLGGVSIIVFLIGLANSGTLLLVRAAQMRYEMAVKAAIGASRQHLIAQSLLEAGLIAGAALTLAWLLSVRLDEAVRGVLFPGVAARSDGGAVAMSAAISAGLLGFAVAAIVNVWHLPKNVQHTELSAHAPSGNRRSRTLPALLLVQTAASVLLLAGAAMFGGSLYRLWAQDFGMSMDEAVIVDFDLGPERVEGQDELFSRALEQLRHMPGIELVTPINTIPFTGFNVPPIAVPGRIEPPAVGRQLPYLLASTPELLKILGVQLLEGRLLTDADDPAPHDAQSASWGPRRGAPVVLVNQSMARGVWPGESAIGKCIRIGFDPDFVPGSGPPAPSDRVPCREVVGVVRDIRQRSVLPQDNEDRLMQYFVPYSQVPFPPFMPVERTPIRGLMLRVSGSVEAMAPMVRRAVIGDRTDLPFVRVQPYTAFLERQLRPWTMGTTLLGLFSALAVLVAAMGLFAAFAHTVGERRREMAIRMAIGARPATVVAMVLREASTLAIVGAVIGCAAAVAAGRWLESLLYGTKASDPLVLGAAASVMLLVALLATLRPATIAARSDPSALLRAQ